MWVNTRVPPMELKGIPSKIDHNYYKIYYFKIK